MRISLLLFVLVSSAPLAIGVLTSVPPARISDLRQSLALTWQRLLAMLPSRPGTQVAAVPVVARVNTGAFPQPQPAAIQPAQPDLIAYGDRLKISFFESLEVSFEASQPGADHAVAAVFPRTDLSGDYAVDQDGTIDIPRLGQLTAVGQTIPRLELSLATAFRYAFGRSSDVHVAIVDRQPVYVIGKVRSPGTFRHTSGMIVLQALANAGGIDRGVVDTSRAIEHIRETERLRQAEDKLDRLLVNHSRLIAERDGSDAIALPDAIKAGLAQASRPGLKAVVAGAMSTMSVERKGYQQQLDLADQRVAIVRLEVEAQDGRISQLRDLLNRKRDKLHELEAIAARGSVSQYKVIDMGAEISELGARQEDLRVALAQAQGRLVEAETARARVKFDFSLRLEGDLAATQQEIDDCQHAIASMQAVTRVLQDEGPAGAASRPNLRITRRGHDGFSVFAATETAPLLPGDVLEVDATGSEVPAANVGEDAQRLQK